ncbi:MAG: DUF58 domain-containing protein [Candidatus Bipolaricaulota bacterium]
MSGNVKLFLFIVGLAAFIGGLLQLFLALFTGVLVIALVYLSYFWQKRVFRHLTLTKELSQPKVELGETVEYELTFENRKFLPALWLKVEEAITEGLDFVKEGVLRKPIGQEKNTFTDYFNLKWFERIRRRYEVEPQKRGFFKLGPAELYYKGPLGLFNNQKHYDISSELVVYPRRLPFSGSDIEPQFLFGSRPRNGWIFTDPLNPVGVRPYQITDDIRQINWKASARHQQLESHIYNPSFDPEIHIFLSAVRGEAWWKQEMENRFELAVICAASIVDQTLKNGHRVGFYTNAKGEGRRGRGIVRPQRGAQQRILTTLALLRPFSLGPITKLMRDVKQQLRPGNKVVLINTTREDDIGPLLSDYARNYRVTIIQVGKGERGSVPRGVDCFYLKGDEPWNEIENLELTK